MKINLGGGMKKMEGWVNVDIRPFPQVDYVLDIGKDKLPFEDNSVYEIFADNVYEHLTPDQLFFSIEECFRVLKPKGFLTVAVPKAGTKAFYIHPDHKIQFIEDTFGFFQVPDNPRHKDPHGYLKGFWNVTIIDQPNPEAVWVKMYPNKPGGEYPYVEVTI